MGDLVGRLLLLAAEPAKAPANEGGAGGFFALMPALFLIMIIFYFMLIRPQNRERQKQNQILKALKKNDRVVTIGGVVGTIVNIEPDSEVVTLRVDDNTRMVFLRSAIQRPFAAANEEPTLKETKT